MNWRVKLHMHVPLHHIVSSSWNNRFIMFLDFASSRLARSLSLNASSNESRSRDCPLQSVE